MGCTCSSTVSLPLLLLLCKLRRKRVMSFVHVGIKKPVHTISSQQTQFLLSLPTPTAFQKIGFLGCILLYKLRRKRVMSFVHIGIKEPVHTISHQRTQFLLSLPTPTTFQKIGFLGCTNTSPPSPKRASSQTTTTTPETSGRASSLLVRYVRLHSFYKFVQHLMAFSSSLVAYTGI
jgi:hypothetical protein